MQNATSLSTSAQADSAEVIEQDYYDIFQHLPLPVYLCDKDGKVREYNKAAAVFSADLPAATKQRWCDSWKLFRSDGSFLPSASCPVTLATRELKTVQQQLILEASDGSRRYVEACTQPLLGEPGAAAGSITVLIDIGAQKQAELALKQAENKLKALRRQKETPPLSAPDEQHFFFKTDLNNILIKVLDDMEAAIEEKHAIIHYNKLPEIEVVPVQIYQLLSSLFSNSLKFVKPGAVPEVGISSQPVRGERLRELNLSEDVPCYEIIFKDNGIGFNQKYAERLFTMHTRLPNALNYPGSGTSLALSRKIAENHNGLLFAESLENYGTSFHLILPHKHSPN